MATAPACVLFLIVERCMILRMAEFGRTRHVWLYGTCVLSVLSIYGSSFGIYLLELPLDLDKGLGMGGVFCRIQK